RLKLPVLLFVLQRIDDSLLVCVEPDSFTVGEFITVGEKKVEDSTAFTRQSLKLEASACRLNLPEVTYFICFKPIDFRDKNNEPPYLHLCTPPPL
uniref:Acylglycerol kinase C-terminal domain-containing protein n=1 Tax=Hucho hucho TaxID=62062 RepID=A0A4W5LC24_9TELE